MRRNIPTPALHARFGNGAERKIPNSHDSKTSFEYLRGETGVEYHANESQNLSSRSNHIEMEWYPTKKTNREQGMRSEQYQNQKRLQSKLATKQIDYECTDFSRVFQSH